MGWWKNAKGYIEGRVEVGGRFVRYKQHRWIMERLAFADLDRDSHGRVVAKVTP